MGLNMSWAILRKILVLSLIIVGLYVWIIYKDDLQIKAIKIWIMEQGVLAPLYFIFLYAVGTVLFLPGIILTIVGGLIFGPWLGTLYNLLGAVIGATAAFLIARYVAREWIEQKLSKTLKVIKEDAEGSQWWLIAIVRLVAVIPFNVANYVLGLSRIRIYVFIFGSGIFMLPGCFVYTYIGSLGPKVYLGSTMDSVKSIMLAVSGLVILACIPWMVKEIRKIK